LHGSDDGSQGLAALVVEREILADRAWDTLESARAQRVQALVHALKRNDWRSVGLLVNAGVALPCRNRRGHAPYRRFAAPYPPPVSPAAAAIGGAHDCSHSGACVNPLVNAGSPAAARHPSSR
jgi:hypothetical protein